MPSCEVLVSDAMYKVYWSDGEYIQGFRSDHLDPNVNLFGTPRKLIGACRPKCSWKSKCSCPIIPTLTHPAVYFQPVHR